MVNFSAPSTETKNSRSGSLTYGRLADKRRSKTPIDDTNLMLFQQTNFDKNGDLQMDAEYYTWVQKTNTEVEHNLAKQKSYQSARRIRGSGSPEGEHQNPSKQTTGGKGQGFKHYPSDEQLRETHILNLIKQSPDETLIRHPLVIKSLNLKWHKYVSGMYYTDLTLYLAFLIALNLYCTVIISYSEGVSLLLPKFEKKSVEILSWIVLILSLARWMIEFWSVKSLKSKYLRDIMNYPEFILYASATYFSLDLYTGYFNFAYKGLVNQNQNNQTSQTDFMKFLPDKSDEYFIQDYYTRPIENSTGLAKTDLQVAAGSLSILLSWLMLLMFLRTSPKLGIYVMMIQHILITFMEFIIILIILLFGFSKSFGFILYKNDSFPHLSMVGLISTMVMTIGEMDYGDKFLCPEAEGGDAPVTFCKADYWLVRYTLLILYAFFIVIMGIIVMNLLTGLAVDDIEKIRKSADTDRRRLIIDKILAFQYGIIPKYKIFQDRIKKSTKQRWSGKLKDIKKEFKESLNAFYVKDFYVDGLEIDPEDFLSAAKNDLWVPDKDDDIDAEALKNGEDWVENERTDNAEVYEFTETALGWDGS